MDKQKKRAFKNQLYGHFARSHLGCSPPRVASSAVGVYRLWRDSGYAIGALLAGVLADLIGVQWAIGVIGVLTILSGVVVKIVMSETLHRKQSAQARTK